MPWPALSTSALLAVRPVINARGIYTDLGGTRLSPAVWARMTDANHVFVPMPDLLDAAGSRLADLLGAEAGTVTCGAAAAIALMVGAAMTRGDGAAGERLPDATGLRDEVVLQGSHRCRYDRQIRLTGARLVVAEDGPAMARAIGPRTAAVYVPAHRDGAPGTLPVAEVVTLAHRTGVPVLVDAAWLCWPLDALPRLVATGADVVCASAKYFGGPNAGGFIVGTRAMVSAVRAIDFTDYESGPHRAFGRPFKLDRHTVVGVVAAFEEWLAMDHGERWASCARRATALCAALAGETRIRAYPAGFTADERLVSDPVNAVVVEPDAQSPPAARLAARLAEGSPRVLCLVDNGRLVFDLEVIAEEELAPLALRIREELQWS